MGSIWRAALSAACLAAGWPGVASACERSWLNATFPGDAVHVLGAVGDAGAVPWSGPLRASDALRARGDLADGAYPLGAMLLRRLPLSGVPTDTGPLDAWHVAMSGDGGDGRGEALAALLDSGCFARFPVAVDIASRQRQPGHDITLQRGDVLFVPYRPGVVAVFGAVTKPGVVAFRSGADVRDYVREAGGRARGARTGNATVYLPQGVIRPLRMSPWNYTASNVPPGSVVFIPSRRQPDIADIEPPAWE